MDWNIINIKETTSTNNYAREVLKSEKGLEDCVISAYSQTEGKGQIGNSWESEAGMNITISIILHPKLKANKQFFLSKIISIGIYDYLKSKNIEAKIKWPNDIYYKKNKIGGILIENSLIQDNIASTICGIGLNINQDVFLSDAPNPISMKQITGLTYNIDEELILLLQFIKIRYSMLNPILINNLTINYLNNLYRLNEEHTFTSKNGALIGKITNVAEDGALIITDNNSTNHSFYFKEVKFNDDFQ